MEQMPFSLKIHEAVWIVRRSVMEHWPPLVARIIAPMWEIALSDIGGIIAFRVEFKKKFFALVRGDIDLGIPKRIGRAERKQCVVRCDNLAGARV